MDCYFFKNFDCKIMFINKAHGGTSGALALGAKLDRRFFGVFSYYY